MRVLSSLNVGSDLSSRAYCCEINPSYHVYRKQKSCIATKEEER